MAWQFIGEIVTGLRLRYFGQNELHARDKRPGWCAPVGVLDTTVPVVCGPGVCRSVWVGRGPGRSPKRLEFGPKLHYFATKRLLGLLVLGVEPDVAIPIRLRRRRHGRWDAGMPRNPWRTPRRGLQVRRHGIFTGREFPLCLGYLWGRACAGGRGRAGGAAELLAASHPVASPI